MMTKRKSTPASRLKYLAIIPGLALVILVVCCQKTESLAPPPPPPPPPYEAALTANDGKEEPGYVFVEEQAQFEGGTIEKFRDWIQANLVYPEEAIKNGISGRVTVQFSVDTEGKVGDIKVLRSASPLLSESAIQALQKSPGWIPAKAKGTVVKQQFVIPVDYSLK